MDMQLTVPNLHAHQTTNRPEMLGGENGLPDAGNTFNRHSFVVLTGGALAAVASGAVLCCGLSLDESKATAVVNPPTQFFGDRHFPVNPRGQRFAVSVVDGAGNVGEVNAAPQMSEVVIGEKYGIIRLADGNHALNVDNTTNDFFVVVEKISHYNGAAQDANTFNPVVIVELLPEVVQSI